MAAAGVDDEFTAARRDDALRTFSRALEARPPGSFAAAPKHEPLSYAHLPPWQANAGSVDLWLLYLECYASRPEVPVSELRDLVSHATSFNPGSHTLWAHAIALEEGLEGQLQVAEAAVQAMAAPESDLAGSPRGSAQLTGVVLRAVGLRLGLHGPESAAEVPTRLPGSFLVCVRACCGVVCIDTCRLVCINAYAVVWEELRAAVDALPAWVEVPHRELLWLSHLHLSAFGSLPLSLVCCSGSPVVL